MEINELELGGASGSGNPLTTKFEGFFNSVYKKEIEKLVKHYPEKRSLEIDFNILDQYDYKLADELLSNPGLVMEAAEEAVQGINIPALEIEEFHPNIRFLNLPKQHQPYLKNLGAKHLGRLICVEGVIRQLTDVLPKLKTATWKCRRCSNTYIVEQDTFQTKLPSMCANCKHRDFELVPEKSTFIDYQKIQIQEPLELLKGNEQAVNLDVYLEDDLVNRVSPGDKTKITGILRLTAPNERKNIHGRHFEALHLEQTAKEYDDVEISKEEEEDIRKLSKDPKIYDILAGSIAPHIYGHQTVKESIAMQLFGGVKKKLPGDISIRGNIHVLLVGDPGTAKSQLLQAVSKIAPRSIYVAGKTSSAVGLTASAVKDEFGEGGWTLKAGALVLASGGNCMVDEFDKMETEDRSAMHEAMEQGMVSVAKAGIVTRFRTDTSILAAANPKFSRFDPFQPFIEQIELPPSLISRFDLFFMIRDILDRKRDENIATHILKTHQAGESMLQSLRTGKKMNSEMLEQVQKQITPTVSSELLKKYISYARQNIYPVLSDNSLKIILDYYLNLRESGKKTGTFSATHRQLEGLVRLSEASARVRLSDTVEPVDAERAIRLVKASLEDVIVDPETGRVDFDMILTGQTQSKTNHIKKILTIIRQKATESDMVAKKDVIEEAMKDGLDQDKVNELIGDLKKRGEIYEPRQGFLKPTQAKTG